MVIDAFSTKGMRKENQDAFFVLSFEVGNKEHTVAVICDGMGGSKDGCFASNLVINKIADKVKQGYFHIEDIEPLIKEIHKEMKSLDGKSGTTCTYLWTDGSGYEIFHLGDSRCYAKIDGKYLQLTEDHSVREDAKRGYFGEKSKDYLNHPENVLSRCVGIGVDPVPFRARGFTSGIEEFLLCSDGFWHFFNVDEEVGNLEDYSNDIIFKGENDNISVVKVVL